MGCQVHDRLSRNILSNCPQQIGGTMFERGTVGFKCFA